MPAKPCAVNVFRDCSPRKRKQEPAAVGQRVGRLLGKNSRAAEAFEIKIVPDANGFASSAGRKSTVGGSGHGSVKVAMCCLAM